MQWEDICRYRFRRKTAEFHARYTDARTHEKILIRYLDFARRNLRDFGIDFGNESLRYVDCDTHIHNDFLLRNR